METGAGTSSGNEQTDDNAEEELWAWAEVEREHQAMQRPAPPDTVEDDDADTLPDPQACSGSSRLNSAPYPHHMPLAPLAV